MAIQNSDEPLADDTALEKKLRSLGSLPKFLPLSIENNRQRKRKRSRWAQLYLASEIPATTSTTSSISSRPSSARFTGRGPEFQHYMRMQVEFEVKGHFSL